MRIKLKPAFYRFTDADGISALCNAKFSTVVATCAAPTPMKASERGWQVVPTPPIDIPELQSAARAI